MLIPARHPNVYSGSPLDRAAPRREDAAWVGALLEHADSLFVPLWRGRAALVGQDAARSGVLFLDAAAALPLRLRGAAWAFLGLRDGRGVFALDLGAAESPPALPAEAARFEDLRAAVGLLDPAEAAVLAQARALLHWRQRHRFCGVCGAACEPRSAGHVMVCTGCGVQHFPRTDPAVIMLVHRGPYALLGHSTRFPNTTMYSTLAGFVEPGETLEEAVAREVREESGILVGRVTYHSSQPWPFPANIMLGFHAEALSEAITVDPEELRDARWFSRDELRRCHELGFSLPRADSIARRLIEDWIDAP